MKAPSLAAHEFLRRYAQGLLGVDPNHLIPGDSRQEGATSQVVYTQEKDGLPVFGTRVNMIFDREGNLVHLVSDLHSGSFPASSPRIEVNSAAAAVRLGIVQRLERDGEALDDEALSVTALAPRAQLGYRMVGASVSLVYRFEFSLADERYGDMEALVDAQSGSLTTLRTLSRN
jgi:Zn-dependent metalloprotease